MVLDPDEKLQDFKREVESIARVYSLKYFEDYNDGPAYQMICCMRYNNALYFITVNANSPTKARKYDTRMITILVKIL